jgi:hypothetical protein
LKESLQWGAEGAWVLPPTNGWESTDPTSLSTAQVLVKNTAGVTISNLIVDATNNNARCSGELTGVSFHNASGTVSRNQLTIESAIQCNGYGLLAFSDNQQPQTVVVQNSDFRNNGYWSLAGVGTGLALNAVNKFVTGGDNSQIGSAGIVYFSDATGTAQGNTVTNEIEVYGAPGAALSNSTAIAVDCASATVTGNVITAAQLGVYVGCTVSGHTDRSSTVTQNKILYTKIGDGIYVASAGNSITKNTVVASASSGIHLDTALGGINNTVSGNTITETCIGILTIGTGGSNTLSANTFNDVYIPTEKGTACAPIF